MCFVVHLIVIFCYQNDQAYIAWFTYTRETIENECNTFEIYLDPKGKSGFSLYPWGYSITYRLFGYQTKTKNWNILVVYINGILLWYLIQYTGKQINKKIRLNYTGLF